MRSRHLVDPQILPLIDMLPAFDLAGVDMATTRALMGSLRPPPLPTPEALKVEERRIPGPDGAPEVRVLVTAPKAGSGKAPALLHLHGGGFVMGAADMSLDADAAYAAALGAVVVSPDYRLAPETPFPGPAEDCYAALAWLHREAADLGVDPARIIVSGESAGGGLAAAVVLMARDRGRISVAFQHLIFPMLDDRTVSRSDRSPFLGEFVWTSDSNRFGWTSMLGVAPGGPDVSPYAAPARAADLTGLPPTFIACGALDLFLEENLEFGRRLICAGAPTELHIYPGAPHAFMMAVEAEVTRNFARDSLAALKRAAGLG